MNIRKAKIEDIEKNLLNIYIDGFYYHYNTRPDIFTKKEELELKNNLIEEIKKSNILILEKDEKVLAYITYQIKEKINKIIWINQLVVDKNYRHLGYGKKLMEKIKELAKAEDCKKIEFCCWSFNKNAMNMYKHIGYKEQRVIFEMDL